MNRMPLRLLDLHGKTIWKWIINLSDIESDVVTYLSYQARVKKEIQAMNQRMNMFDNSELRKEWKQWKHLYAHKKGAPMTRTNVAYQTKLQKGYERLKLEQFLEIFTIQG